MKNNTSTHPFRLGKLALGAVGFVLLTGGVFWHQFSRVPADAAAPTWNALRWDYLALIVLCLPVESVTCGLRTAPGMPPQRRRSLTQPQQGAIEVAVRSSAELSDRRSSQPAAGQKR